MINMPTVGDTHLVVLYSLLLPLVQMLSLWAILFPGSGRSKFIGRHCNIRGWFLKWWEKTLIFSMVPIPITWFQWEKTCG